MSELLRMLLVCPLLITLRLFVVGIALSWFLPRPLSLSESPWCQRLIPGARALLVGVLISAFLVFGLGQFGLYRSAALEGMLLGGLSLAGIVPALLLHRGRFWQYCKNCAPVAALSLCGISAIMSLPERDEWALGGWDPGVYISEGVALAQQGTFYPEDPLLFEQFNDAEKAVFTRTGSGRTERFPGVVLDFERQSLSYEFFRLYPAMIASFYRCGGITAAMRGNSILGLFVCFLFLAMLLEYVDKPHAIVATVILMTQPLWLYHAHTPVSEMLHLFLMLGAGLILPYRARGLSARILFAILLLALTLNRFSFLPFAGILIVGVAWSDLDREDRGNVVIERLLQFAAVIVGAWIDLKVAPASLRGWSHSVLSRVLSVAGGGALVAVAVDLLGVNVQSRRFFAVNPRWARLAFGWSFVGVVLVLYGYGLWGHGDSESDNLCRLVPYLGYVTLGVALCGGLLLVHRDRTISRVFGCYLVALLGMLLIVLLKKWAVDLYPWATRRYLASAVPLVAILAAYPVAKLWQSPRFSKICKVAAVVLLLVIVGSNAKRSWHAWSRVETHGVLATLDKIVEQVEADDIIIVDDPAWGMPLRLIYGVEVLNGKHMWRRKDAEKMQVGLDALTRLHAAGKRIRFLTTTRTLGLDIYPVPITPVTLDWMSNESVLEEIEHGSQSDDFYVREKRNVLRLYTWTPSDQNLLITPTEIR
jgi:hypothetical protein